MKRSARPALVIALTLVAACAGDDDPTGTDAAAADADIAIDAEPLSPSCIDAEGKSDIIWIHDNIFASCSGFSVCHQGAAMSAANLNLESGFAETAMVNVDSQLFSDYKLVVPGDPDNSYLMIILGGAPGPLKDGVGTMPYNNPPLCQPKIDAIGRWISSLPH